MKNFKSSFIFLIVLLIIASYAYFFEYKHKEKKEKIKAFKQQLVSYDKEDINSLTIKNNANIILLKKTTNVWNLIEPVKKTAKQDFVEEIINNLLSASTLIIENPKTEDLQKFSINENLYIKVNTKDANMLTLKFGDKAPISEETYILVENNLGSKIVLHSINLYNNINKNIYDFRDNKIFKNTYDVDKISSPAFSLEKSNKLWINKKLPFSIDQTQLLSFIDSIFSMQAKDFLINKELSQEDLSSKWRQYKLNQANLSFELKDNKVLNFYVSSVADKNYFSYETIEFENNKTKIVTKSEIFEIEHSYLNNFNKDAYSFFDKNIFNFNKDKVFKIEVFKHSRLASLLVKVEDTWLKDSDKFSSEKADTFISEFKDLKILNFLKDYLNFKRFSLDKANYNVVFKDQNDNIIFSMAFGNINKEKAHVSIRFNDIIYQINSDIINKIEDFIEYKN